MHGQTNTKFVNVLSSAFKIAVETMGTAASKVNISPTLAIVS